MLDQESFELQILRDKRWIIESVFSRQEEAEEAAMRLFEQYEDAEAAKITRQVKSMLGGRWENVVAEIPRPAAEKALKLMGDPALAPVCRAQEDIYDFAARLAIGRLYKMFLDQWQLTASELLYSAAFLKKLEDQNSLLMAGMHQAATAHAKKLNVTAPERLAIFQATWQMVNKRAGEFMGRRRQLPKLAPDVDLNDFFEELKEKTENPADANYDLIASICLIFMDMNSRAVKRAWLLERCETLKQPVLVETVDGLMADTLCTVQEVDDLIGHQVSLLMFLGKLIKLIKGDGPWLGPQKELQILVGLMATDKFPQTMGVLIDCMIRLINSETPLDRREPEKEEALLKELQALLMLADGSWLGGKVTQTAVENRRLRERKRKLRAMGLDDVADAVG